MTGMQSSPTTTTTYYIISLVPIPDSDGHGFENPCGFAGTGHAGTGTGDHFVTRDIPVPVPAGDGYVTGT
jgi:hypothetical protein